MGAFVVASTSDVPARRAATTSPAGHATMPPEMPPVGSGAGPLLGLPPDGPGMYDDVLYPTDGETGAEAGFDRALAAARTFDARLHVLYVADTTRESVTNVLGEVVDALEREGREVVEAYVERADDRGVDAVDAVVQGRPHEAIVEYAEGNADLVVLPSRSRTGVTDHLLGSTTERVIRTADTPVLSVPVG